MLVPQGPTIVLGISYRVDYHLANILTLSSPEFPSITHHSTMPSDLPIYTFLSYPSTQFTSFLGPSSFVAVPLPGELEGFVVVIAFLPAAEAMDAAEPNSDPEVAGGEDGPEISFQFPSYAKIRTCS
jgi:hypothetical protein